MLNPVFIKNCFGANYIGIRGYCDDASLSGYFINDEASITLKGIAKLATSDDVKAKRLIERILGNAVRETANDFIDYMAKYGEYVARNITSSKEVNSNLSSQLKMKDLGRFMSVRLDYVKVPQDVTLYIDNSGIRETIELTAGVNSLHKIIIGDAINFHFWTSNSIITLTEIPKETASFITTIEDNESVSGLTGEVTFRISAMCSMEKLVCDNKQLLARAIYFHTVGLFFKEKWQSNKIDPFVSNSKEESEELYNEYLNGYDDKDSKYKTALIAAVRGLKQNMKKNYCFTCTGLSVHSLL